VTARVLLLVVAGIILVMSLLPQPPKLPGFDISDKLDHFAAYIALGACAFAAVERKNLAAALIMGAACSAFGGAIELIQPFFSRDCDIRDFAMDVAGVVLGAAAAALVSSRMRRHAEPKGQ
jgi:VanZ family protein